MSTLAVFGDVHGHLRLVFSLCRRWQDETGRRIDAILQCGDMGWFPDPTRIDRATKKYAKEDPDELGVSRFFAHDAPETDERLEDDLCEVAASLYWAHGNHEDFDAIRKAAGDRDVVPVDRFERILWCRSGTTQELAGVRVGFLGGGPEHDSPTDPWEIVQSRDVNALVDAELDVLVTHPAPRGIGGDSDQWGSALVRRLVERAQPAWHVFGHHREPIPDATIRNTRCRWLNDTSFERDGRLRPGCMAIFENGQVSVVDDPWIRAVGRWNS